MEEYEMRKQNQRLQERSATTMSQMERTQRLLDRIRCESARKSTEMDKLQQEFSSLGDRLRALENKAMEVEKLEISVETLRKNLENAQQDVRDRERQVRQLERMLETKEKAVTRLESQVSELEVTNRDYKLQVKEEIVKNTALEMRIENTDRLKEELIEKKQDIERMKKEQEERDLVALHARKCLREERDKCKRLEDNKNNAEHLREELEIVTSENMTLKRLLAAKDAMIQKRSRAAEKLKHELRNHVSTHEYNDIIKSLEEQTENNTTSKPHSARSLSSKKSNLRTEDSSARKSTHLTVETPHDPHRRRKHSGSSHHLLQTILNGDAYSDDDENDHQRRHKPASAKPRVYNDSFSDFRTISPSNNDVTSVNSYSSFGGSQSNGSHLRRTQSMRVSSLSKSSSTVTSASIEHLNSVSRNDTHNGRFPVSKLREIQTDVKLKSCVRSGDRVVVDMTKKKGGTKDLQTGVVKYVGHVEGDAYRTYVGLKLDGPDGDTDGLYRGKRYFRVSPCHGKFIRIQKVLSVFDKESGAYCQLDMDKVREQRSTTNQTHH